MYTRGAHVSVDWVKIDVGTKIATKVNLGGLKRVVFLRGSKSQL